MSATYISLADAHRTYPDVPGVYTLTCHDRELSEDLLGREAATFPLYVGRATSLYRRLRLHLTGPSAASTFRMSLGLMLDPRLKLEPQVADVGGAIWFAQEDVLSEWIANHVTVKYVETPEPAAIEAELIRRIEPPLNIQMRHRKPTAVRLARARAALRSTHRGAA